MPTWEELEQQVRKEAQKNVEKILGVIKDGIEHAIKSEDEWLKLKEMYGWSFETAEEAQVVIEGNKHRKGTCFHCDNDSELCEGRVSDGHWYCCPECSAAYVKGR
jgi:hypothetical protein